MNDKSINFSNVEQLSLDIEGVNSIILTDRQTDRQPQTLAEKIEQAKQALILAAEMSQDYYKKPLIITYSGGKDSDVLLRLAEEVLKPEQFEVLNSHTTVDAPETVYHIRETIKRLNAKGIKATIHYPKDKNGEPITMWSLIVKKQIPPTRYTRYCCEVLKETSTPNRMCAVGVRADESQKRKGRDLFIIRGAKFKDAKFFSLDHAEEVYRESREIQDDNWDCTLIQSMKNHNHVVVNPIYYWEDEDIWAYIEQEQIKTNPLYKKGYSRVGCIGCPLATYKHKMKEFTDYPTYKKAYINAFDKMLEVRKASGKDDVTGKEDSHRWENGQDVYEWWIEEFKRIPKGQLSLFDDKGQNDY